jgi:V8-like Glu-specific endopeptidase
MSRLLKAATLSSMALGMSLALAGGSFAQISNGAGVASAGPSGPVSSSEPSGSGLGRLPTTTPAVMPYLNTGGTPAAGQVPGNSAAPGVGTNAFGLNDSFRWPYTIARVAVTGSPYVSASNLLVPAASAPYRFSGKLWMRFGANSWFVCTASLVKRALLVTAAHCVHNYGQGQAGFANEVRWYPSNYDAAGGPWGYYSGTTWIIPGVYSTGTDTCQSGAIGVVCNNDIAVVRLAPKNNTFPGSTLGGWHTYGWNGYSYITSPVFGNATVAQITQIGYPVAIDNGYQMLRGDSYGKYIQATGANGKVLKNTQLGSAMTGGSSGGPWLVNYGTQPTVTGSANLGNAAVRNVVVGVTSWGYTAVGINVQGASFFGQNAEFPLADYGGYGAGNIGRMIQAGCTGAQAGTC